MVTNFLRFVVIHFLCDQISRIILSCQLSVISNSGSELVAVCAGKHFFSDKKHVCVCVCVCVRARIFPVKH